MLSKIVNENSQSAYGDQYEVRYSTMDEFLEAVKGMELEYDTYIGDFLPQIEDTFKHLGEKPHAVNFWTGYYANKPVLKTSIRELLK